jgi:hypothetical protein
LEINSIRIARAKAAMANNTVSTYGFKELQGHLFGVPLEGSGTYL